MDFLGFIIFTDCCDHVPVATGCMTVVKEACVVWESAVNVNDRVLDSDVVRGALDVRWLYVLMRGVD